MKFKFLGRNGLQVSAVGFGCMGLSHAYGAPTDKKEAMTLLASAVDGHRQSTQHYGYERCVWRCKNHQ